VKKFLLLFLFFSISACSPTYKTTYSYEPPDDDGGLRCVFQCRNIKAQCAEIKRLEIDRCRTRNDNFYYRCVERNRGQRNRSFCSRGSCPFPDYSRCDAVYRRCYKNCGGTVTSNKKCISFCNDSE